MFNIMTTNIILSTVLIFTILLGQGGCSKHFSASDIMNNSLSAMEKVTSFQLDTNVSWNYTTIVGSASSKSSVIWIGELMVDIVNKAFHQLMNTEDAGDSTRKIHWTIESYIDKGYAYSKANSDFGQSNSFNVWYKSKASESGWISVNQISELIGLMKTSTGSTSAGNEKLDGKFCYILNIQPSIDAIADWVTTQFHLPGPADFSTRPFLGGREDYLKFFNSGSFKIWIAKDTFLVMKAEIAPHFEATPQDLGVTSQAMKYIGFDKVMSDFQGEMNFSKYNQPVSIQPPSDSEVVSR